MKIDNKKPKAILAVALLMAVAIGGAIIVDDDMTDESDAVIPAFVILGVFILGAVIGGVTVWLWPDEESGPNNDYTRSVEAEKVAESILAGLAYYRNALNNYDQVWKLTDEHWIRAAEITAAATWSDSKDYDPSVIMLDSGLYTNSANMMVNASAQVSEHFHSISDRLNSWNGLETYSNKMTLEWRYGSQKISSKTSFDGWLKSVVDVQSADRDKAFLVGGDFWNFGSGSATLTGSDGLTITVPSGHTDLDSIPAFQAGVYELQSGHQYAGDMLYVIDSQAVPITSGIVMKAGATEKLAIYQNGRVVVDSASYDTLSIAVVPDGGSPQVVDISKNTPTDLPNSALNKFNTLMGTVNHSMAAANSAAVTMWNIYDRAGEASIYLTTLMVPNFYDNVQITQAQQEIITTLAMEQLAKYWQANGGKIKTGNYTFTEKSMNLYVRGDIIDQKGDILFRNAIFSPFYYGQDLTLTTGSNPQTQPAIIAIWDHDKNLSSWNPGANITEAQLTTTSTGHSIFVHEIMYDGQIVSSVNLDIKNIDIIDPEQIKPIITPDPPGSSDWIQMLCIILIILGLASVLLYPLHKRIFLSGGGVICIIIGGVLYVIKDSLIGGFL